jgi:hypothetical protein
MQETFSLKFDVHYGEYAGSLFRHFLKSKYLRFFLLFLLGLIVLMTLLGLATSPEMNFWVSILSSILPIIVISVFAPILFFIFTALIYLGSRFVFKDINIEFTHRGVNRKSDRINLSKPWREIVKAEETKKAFHIYISKNDFIIIPKRAFKDDAEINSFGYFLSTRTDFKL